jgi:hypothetical protein
MDKESLEKRIKELEDLKIKIENKKQEVDMELTGLRYQLCDILEEEESSKPPLDTSFLDNPDWSGFG